LPAVARVQTAKPATAGNSWRELAAAELGHQQHIDHAQDGVQQRVQHAPAADSSQADDGGESHARYRWLDGIGVPTHEGTSPNES
jgi:hypothetical protein